MITIIDYGVGNLKSVQNAFLALKQNVEVTADPEKIMNARTLVLPGQGAFASAMDNLKKLGLDQLVKMHIRDKRAFLGICVGFQLLFECSFEHGVQEGLSIFPGDVQRFETNSLKIPHMGWNKINIVNDNYGFFRGIPTNSYVYFVHSYYVASSNQDCVAAETEYGIPFVSAIHGPNLLATQFHPEKSGSIGLKLLTNFLNETQPKAPPIR
ncbi:imidazole glycerol phosphate synthase subunit HisH [Thermoproteota archaeon]